MQSKKLVVKPALLRADEQSRQAFYKIALNLGLDESESRSTSVRNSRGRK